VKEALQPLHK